MSIVRRIKREARNNPAKAALLVGLLGLAVYFWAPLLAGWLGNGSESKTSSRPERTEDDPATLEPVASKPEDNTQQDKNNEPSWVELRQWHNESPWTSPVELASLRDPFVSPHERREEVADAPDENNETLQATPEQTIADMNIQLTGTIVGPRRRVALLDGRTCHEGDVIRVEQLGTTWELEVREIGNNRVKLGWNSIERIVTAPERPNVGRIELVNRTK